MTTENVTIQDLLTALLYWRSKAKELQEACNLASIYVVQGSGGLNANPDLAAAHRVLRDAIEATHARPQS